MAGKANSFVSILYALGANFAIFVAKLAGALITGSSAMLAEAVHSLADCGTQGLLLLGMNRSRRPPTPDAPLGYGKAIYFWSFIVAMTLFSIGATFSIYEGVIKTINPHPITSITVNFIVLGISIMLELYSFQAAWKEFNRLRGMLPIIRYIKETKDPVAITVLFEDTAALIGLIVALFGLLIAHETGNPIFDGIASIVIGVILGMVAVVLAWESKSLLIGESASDEDLRKLKSVIEETDGVSLNSEIMTMHLDPSSILVNLSLDFEKKLNSDQVETITAIIEEEMKRAVPSVTQVFIEASSFVRKEGRE